MGTMQPGTITVILFLVIGISAANSTVSSIERNKRATKKIFNSLLGLIDKFGNDRPQEGNHQSSNQCAPSNKCRKGHGDCETDQDCHWGLFCGKNNCKGEFGSHSPQGITWEGKDDCCTNNRNYCNPADRIPFSRRTCCSSSNPCPFSHGDCDKDSDCQSGLICGDNNCKDFHKGAGNKDDCCVYPNGGSPHNGGTGNRPSVWSNSNTGSQANGNSKLSGCEANPSFRCCTKHRPCALGGGDCSRDEDCQEGLVCGSNNCRKFHPNADRKMDCCAFKKFK